MRLAYYSPLDLHTTGVSIYSLDLLPVLARAATVDVYTEGAISDPAAVAGLHVYDVGENNGAATVYDARIFQIGNGPAHEYVYKALTQPSAGGAKIVVLHDYVLQHLFSGLWRGEHYVNAMREAYGAAGAAVAQAVMAGKQPPALFTLALNAAVVEAADVVLVHSDYAADLLQAHYPHTTVVRIPLGVPLLDIPDPDTARERLGLPADTFVALSLGNVSPYKRIDAALSAFALFAREHPNSLYLLVGSPSPGYDLRRAIRVRDLEARVKVVGFADDAAMRDYIAAADVCINLRYPTAGETSGSQMRLMSAGRPVMISNVDAFAETPDAACIKIDTDGYETGEILAYLRRLADDPALRAALGHNARNFVGTRHRVVDTAAAYMDAIGAQIGQPLSAADVLAIAPPPPATFPSAPLPAQTRSRRSHNNHTQTPALETPPATPQTVRQEIAQTIAELGIDPDDPSDSAGTGAMAGVVRAMTDLGLV